MRTHRAILGCSIVTGLALALAVPGAAAAADADTDTIAPTGMFDILPNPSPPAEQLGTQVSIEHTFTVKGRGGSEAGDYAGTASFAKIGGDMYNATWHLGARTQKGICFRDDDQLSCAWGQSTKGLGVIAYLVSSNGLNGVWFQSGGTKLGKEFLSPSGPMPKNVAGAYTISKGENPDGSKYSGTTSVTQVAEGVYAFRWTIGGSTIKGIGVRLTGGEDDVIATAFDPGGDYGAVQYKIGDDGKSLAGVTAQSVGGRVVNGREQLTQK